MLHSKTVKFGEVKNGYLKEIIQGLCCCKFPRGGGNDTAGALASKVVAVIAGNSDKLRCNAFHPHSQI